MVTPPTMPVLAAGASSGHTPGLMFDVSSIPGQLWQRGIHCVGAQALAVTFLVNDTVYPPVMLYERTGVLLSVQLAGGVYAVVKGVGLQLLSQNAANSRCPAPQSMPPDMLQTCRAGRTKYSDAGVDSDRVAKEIRKLQRLPLRVQRK